MKISVALCTFNGEKYLETQLQSILAQNIPVDEIIICDDVSHDNTHEISGHFKKQFPDIFRIYFNESRLGVVKNFEKAISLCSGEIIFLCDQDDIWLPEKTQKTIKFFEENSQFDAVFHNLYLLRNNENQQKTIWETLDFNPNIHDNASLLKILLYFENVVTGATLAIKKPKTAVQINTENLFHDHYLALQFAAENKLGVLNEVLGFYRIHEQQKVGANSEKSVYTKEISRQKKIYDQNADLPEKLRIINRGIQKAAANLSDSSFFSQINSIMKKDLLQTRDQYLKNLSFIKRKKILASWCREKRYYIRINDIFSL